MLKKVLVVQPLGEDNSGVGRIPYPYFVDCKTGLVLRQDFWRGTPERFLCFEKPNRARDFVMLRSIVNGSRKLQNTFKPCFQDGDGSQYTMTNRHGFEYSIREMEIS